MSKLTETKEGEWLAICPRVRPLDYYKTIYELSEENAKLKELLKECKEVMSTGGYIFATVKQVKRARKLLENIDQALGEGK